MSDRLDPRARELVYRLMAMAPDAPPFPEEAAAMKVPETKSRSPILVWVAAAAAVVLLVGLPLILFRGGEPSGPATTIAAPTSAAPSTSTPDSTTTAPPSGITTEHYYAAYVFSDAMSTAVGDPALVPVERFTRHPGEAVSLSDEQIVSDALASLAEQPDDGFTTSVPLGVVPISVFISDRVATVDYPAAFETGGGTLAMTTRLAQVVYTATQLPGVDSVLFSIDGQVVDVFSSEGIVLDGPQTREDYVDILPQIFLDNPVIGSFVSSPVTISGIANVFEATVSHEILDASGTVLAAGFTNATCGTGCWGDFSVSVDFSVAGQTEGEVVVYESSARDGSRINELRYPVSLLPGESSSDTTIPSTTEPDTISTTSLPGEEFDIGPQAGDVVAVVGVAHDDVLNLRDGPGTGYEIMATLDPLADDLVATGRHRLLSSSIWSEVEADGVTGWVNQSYLAYLGAVNDETSYVVDKLGEIPQAETMVDLGTLVAEQYASTEPASDIVMSVAPTVGDLGEITYDVIGLGDDAQVGVRLHVFGQPTAGGEGFSLKSVEVTGLCGRGVTADGLCI